MKQSKSSHLSRLANKHKPKWTKQSNCCSIESLELQGTFKVHIVQPSWTETPTARSGCSQLHPAWLWMSPKMGHPPHLQTICSRCQSYQGSERNYFNQRCWPLNVSSADAFPEARINDPYGSLLTEVGSSINGSGERGWSHFAYILNHPQNHCWALCLFSPRLKRML